MAKEVCLIIGLGNPGEKYAHTRHNAGFEVLDRLAGQLGVTLRKKLLLRGAVAEVADGERKLVLVEPQTFMNDSGDCVRRVVSRYGVPREKTVIGAAFYSRRWDGLPNENHGLFRMSGTVGQYGPGYTKLEEEFINKNGFTRYWDDDAKAPFLFNGSSLISYDDPESIRLKCEYLKAEGLKGIMYWDHGSDPSRALLGSMWTAIHKA